MNGVGFSSGVRRGVQAVGWTLLAAFAAVAPAWASGQEAPAGAADDHVLVLGRVSDDPRMHYDQLKALLDYVVPRMADVGITGGRVLMARDPAQMASYLRRGRVDWVTGSATIAVQLQQRADARVLLLAERDGVTRYRTLFFARRDSPVRGLADLRGRTLALRDASSTSAYQVPMITLLDQDLVPEILAAPGEAPSPGRVGYLFARSEMNIAVWVHRQRVDAGAVSDLDWNDPARMPPAFKSSLRVVHQTGSFPRAVELVGPGMRPEVEVRLRQVLLEAADDPAGGPALRAYFDTSRFLPVDEEMQRALGDLREGVARVRAEVE